MAVVAVFQRTGVARRGTAGGRHRPRRLPSCDGLQGLPEAENLAKAAALLDEQRAEAQRIRTSLLAPFPNVSIILKNGETAYWEEPCEIYREQSLQEFGLAGRGNVSYDVGKIVITDRRVVFAGAKETVEIPLERIVSLSQTEKSFTVSVANGKTRLLGTGNPRAAVVVARILETELGASPGTLGADSATGASEPLQLQLEMQITGAPDQVSGYLNELADRLQGEIDARKERARWGEPTGTVAVTPSLFTSAVTNASKQMSRVFEDVDKRFATAAARPGQTEGIRAPYATLADGILRGMDAFWKMEPPPEFVTSYREYRAMLHSMYEQLAEWPARIREAAAETDALGCDVKLSIDYDVSKPERALRAETFP